MSMIVDVTGRFLTLAIDSRVAFVCVAPPAAIDRKRPYCSPVMAAPTPVLD
jgi:hypothetical protein